MLESHADLCKERSVLCRERLGQKAMGSAVRAIQMILPDGGLVIFSRKENACLFDMTMGGYGLTGIITRLDVDLSGNLRLFPIPNRCRHRCSQRGLNRRWPTRP